MEVKLYRRTIGRSRGRSEVGAVMLSGITADPLACGITMSQDCSSVFLRSHQQREVQAVAHPQLEENGTEMGLHGPLGDTKCAC